MAMPSNVIAHWDHLLENFQASSMEFYSSLEKAIHTRSLPESQWMRVEHKEGGLGSAYRIYFRTQRGRYAFDICAAPFGTGFFISWWLTEPSVPFGILYTLGFLFCLTIAFYLACVIGMGIGYAVGGYVTGILFGGSLGLFGVPISLWLVGQAIRKGAIPGESTVLGMPLIGWIYERIFAPTTLYAIDTALMFEEAVRRAVLEVVDCMTEAKGVRALSEAERKPILKRFAALA